MFSKTTLLIVAFAGLASSAPLIQKRDHEGMATFYEAGQGNCGGWNTGSDMIVALNTAMYGSTSQQSKYCGQTVHITNKKTGKTQDAKIVDSCPSCPGSGDLDMSTGLFHALGGTTNEGEFPISWTFGSGGSGGSSSSGSGGGDGTQDKSKSKDKSKAQNQSPKSQEPKDDSSSSNSGSNSDDGGSKKGNRTKNKNKQSQCPNRS